MAFMGYRPYVPKEPTSGLRPGTPLNLFGGGHFDNPTPEQQRRARQDLEARGYVSPVPVHEPLTPYVSRLRWSVGLGGLAWLAVGVLEAVTMSLFGGIVCAGVGGLALRRVRSLGVSHSDQRVPPSDRPSLAVWWLVPIGALPVIARGVWLASRL